MLKKFSVIAAAAVATVAVAACGAVQLDVKSQTQTLADTMTDASKAAEIENGYTEAELDGFGFDFTCPGDVKADQDVNCTVTGKLSGESAEVAMKTDSNSVLAFADNDAYTASVAVIDKAEVDVLQAGTN